MLTRETLREIMDRVAAATDVTFHPTSRLKEKTIQNALSTYAKGCRREDILGIYDTSMFGSGKSGILLAADGIYSNEFLRFAKKTGGQPKIPLAGICSAEKGGTNNAFLTVGYRDGRKQVVYVGNVYDLPVLGILQEVIRQGETAPAAPQPPEPQEPIITGPAAGKRDKTPEPQEEPVAELTFDEIFAEAAALETPPAAPAEPQKAPVQTPPPVRKKAEEIPAQTPPPVRAEPEKRQPSREKSAKKRQKEEAEGMKYFQAGLDLFLEDETAEALPLLLKGAELGVTRAQKLCATIYEYEGDDEQVLYWYRKAAEGGDAEAQVYCAIMYENGEGTEVDLEQALYWYEKAAQQGDAQAQYHCGILYSGGLGTPEDKQAALTWYLKAAQQGVTDAQVKCALLLKGDGSEEDWERSRTWLQQAADQGDEGARLLLEECF